MSHTSSITAAALLLSVTAAMSPSAHAQSASPIAGTWTLVAADLLHADGTRTPDYGASPKGLLIVDAKGRYSLQIFRSERPRFASGDKVTGTAAELQAAVIGSSTHFGRMSLDTVARVLTVKIEGASFPNQEGTQQQRAYVLEDDQLSYNVPARADGNTPITVWQRVRE
jgi:hypothetical protein